jgi:hypothetical protein
VGSKKRGYLGDEAAQNRLRKLEQLRERQADGDLKALMLRPEFRRWSLQFLEDVCGVFSETFTGTSETFHREGKRAAGITLLQSIQRLAPDEYVRALGEEMERRRREQTTKDDAVKAAEESDDGG